MQVVSSHKTLFKKAAILGVIISLASVILFVAFGRSLLEGPEHYWTKEANEYYSDMKSKARRDFVHTLIEAAETIKRSDVSGRKLSDSFAGALVVFERDLAYRSQVWLYSSEGEVYYGVPGENRPLPTAIEKYGGIDSCFFSAVHENRFCYLGIKSIGSLKKAKGRIWNLAVMVDGETALRHFDADGRIAGFATGDSGTPDELDIGESVTDIRVDGADGSTLGTIYINTVFESFADKYLWGWQITLLGILPILCAILFVYLIYRYFASFADHSVMLGRLLRSDKPGVEIFRRDQHIMEKYMPELAELFILAGENLAEKMYFKKSLEQVGMSLEIVGEMGYEAKALSDVLEFLFLGLHDCGGVIFTNVQSGESAAIAGRYNISDDLLHALTQTPRGAGFMKLAAKQMSRTSLKDMQNITADNDLGELFARYGSAYIFPLRFKGKLVGIMLLVSGENESKAQLFSGISDLVVDLIAMLTYGSLLERDKHIRADSTRILQETSLAISSTLDLPSVLRIVAHRLTDYTEAAYCMILLRIPGSDEMDVASFFIRRREGISAPPFERVNLAEFPGLGKAVQSNRAMVLDSRDIADLSDEEKHFVNSESIESITVLPIAHSAKFIGSIVLGEERSGARGSIGGDKLTIIQAIASQAASAIENARLYGFIKEKVDQLTASYNVSAIINSEINIDRMLSRVLEATKEYLNFSYSIIYSVDDERRILEPIAYRGFRPEEALGGTRSKGNDSIAGLVASTGEAVGIEDTRLDSDLRSSFENALSELAVPIKISEKVVGVFSVGSEARSAFSNLDEEFLQSLAAQIAVAMEKVQLFEQEKERAKRLKIIYEFSRQTSKTLNINEVLELAADSVRDAFGCHLVVIMLRENNSDNFYLARRSSISAMKLPDMSAGLAEKSLLGRTVKLGRTLYCVDSITDPDYLLSAPNLRSEVCVPIMSAERIIGVLGLGSSSPNNFSSEDISTVEALSDILAVAIEKSFLFRDTTEKAERLSLIDKINTAISTALDLDSFFNVVAKAVSDNAGYKWTLLLVPDGDSFSCKAAYSPRSLGDLYPGPVLEILQGKLKQVFSSGSAEFVSFAELAGLGKPEKLQPAVSAGIRHLVLLPIMQSEKCEAVLMVGSSRHNGFTGQELSLLHDITVHLQIAWQNARLYEQLKTAYRQLQEAQDQVIQTEKLRALGEMSSGVVHDFNNILAAILGRVQLMIRKTEDVHDKKWLGFFEKNLTIIETAVQDGSNILSRISEFTKRKPSEKFVTISLDKIISDVIELTKPRWYDRALSEGKKINVQFEKSGMLRATGSPSELREVFTNLINNAADAIQKQGVIKIRARNEGVDRIQIIVEDNGLGMSEETKKRIFEPFFTTKGKSGTGLGLSVTYGIINRHNGTIDVESTIGKGTIFKVTLPISLENPNSETPETEANTDTGSKKILIVDDEESLREILEEILESIGHKIDTASGGNEAINMLAHRAYDLVITDLGMEDISGWELADRIYNDYPDIRVIVATGWGAQVEQGTLALHHVNGLISKPFKISEISDIVEKVMSISRDEVLVDEV